MLYTIYSIFGHLPSHSLWKNGAPIREELFGIERLEEHAISLAKVQRVSDPIPVVLPLDKRVEQNSAALLMSYNESAAELEAGCNVVPAAEWLLDNYHLVEEQIREIKDDLPARYYHQLPKLSIGPLAGYPRVFELAWAFVAHTDSHVDPETLNRFINAYQTIQALSIGELWAVAITLRIVLIENLRRLSDEITVGRAQRADADNLTNQLLVSGCAHSALQLDIASRSLEPLSEAFAAQLAKRLRDQDPKTTPALEWLEQRLKTQNITVEEVVEREQKRQGASNVSIRNVIISMRLISDIDWSKLFEKISLVDKELHIDCVYATMDFPTRNLYRSAIEELARGSRFSEIEIAKQVIKTAQEYASSASLQDGVEHSAADKIEQQRLSNPGYYLINQGRLGFEKLICYKPTFKLRIRRFHIQLGIRGYTGSITLVALCFLALALLFPSFLNLSAKDWLLWFIIGFIPVSEVASAIVNRLVSWRFGPVLLPGLELKSGVPTSLRTLIAVPTLLTSKRDLLEQIERLEVHYLSGNEGDVSFALLTDGIDADQEELPDDAALIALAVAEIEVLNNRHSDGPAGKRFILLHRRRLFNPSENKWMGWERKRGKLKELNRLLRGATDTTYIAINGHPPTVPNNVRYVITLDADTRLPREAALRLIGKMAHPLNRPRLDHTKQRVVAGYAILQPRVTPSLSIGTEGSLYQRIFSAPGGIDPYAAAISDVYQDLFGEGSFTGKGIYDVDMFEAALADRVPENTMLSHDLFEGIFARAGLVTDVEVVEEFPARYDAVAKRQHRWIRGDWQLLPWILSRKSAQQGVSQLGRWKLLDNLRRSLVAPMTLLALVICWLLLPSVALLASGLLLASMAIPVFIPCLFSLFPKRSGVVAGNYLRLWLGDLKLATSHTLLSIAFLPDQSWRTLDAIGRTLFRLFLSHKHCLEWTTAADCNCCPRLNILGFYRAMAGGTLLGLVSCLIALIADQTLWPLLVPFLLLWSSAPLLALLASRPPEVLRLNKLNADATTLRLTARRTWRYFETFVTSEDNMLPPDNFQEDPKPVIAHRTSPTNIGLYLLSTAVAHDLGWAGLLETIERLEATFTTLQKLPKYNGHFFNWYDTQTIDVLLPEYISSVDSGNLAGHLIALANSCEEWHQPSVDSNAIRFGLMDNFKLASEVISLTTTTITTTRITTNRKQSATPDDADIGALWDPLVVILDEIGVQLNSIDTFNLLLPGLTKLTAKAVKLARELSPVVSEKIKKSVTTGVADRMTQNYPTDLIFWLDAAHKLLLEQQRDKREYLKADNSLSARLTALATSARSIALAMDFSFLIDQQRKLLSIGYSLKENSLDPSCYDLLASEARLASLFAIAKGDVATKHWFRLGRSATPMGMGSALISWSGSMFEYLMPSLVMRAPVGSLLEQTNRLIVQHQQDYGRHLNIPWGVSESGYNARDIEFIYQYSNFGVPGLGLKRGLAENIVIAPYATGLATMVDPRAAVLNYNHLATMGACGSYGFYEALDFTPSRLPAKSDFTIVRSFMAHHQGMTIVAIANTLHDGLLRRRFHQEPMIQACELLLQERMPRDVSINHPRAEEVKISGSASRTDIPTVRHLDASADGAPVTHLLSNGRYAVMLTSSGAGYSRWRDIAITRWQEDTTCDQYGSFIFLRDLNTGKLWSSGVQPLDGQRHFPDGLFEEDHAEFIRHDGSLTTTMEVLVSGEDDCEVRRISLNNNGHSSHDIELTSFAELVLTTPEIDNAHPAFAKMFVQTEYLADYSALIATRRIRAAEELPIWTAHFAIVEGEVTAEPQYETNRALFIGRGNSVSTASAFVSTIAESSENLSPEHHVSKTNHPNSKAQVPIPSSPDLSNTVGTVLDAIFSLRYRVHVPAGSVARIAFWTLVASSREELIDLIDRHHDRSAYDRAKTLAWTQAQVQLHHLNISSSEAADFQRMASPILYADPRFRASAQTILRGIDSQSRLWEHSIAGDLPIVLIHIDDVEDIDQVKQLLRAHEYWQMKRLSVDLVIINEHAGSYRQELQIAIETAVRSSQSRPRMTDKFSGEHKRGSVHMLRADLMNTKARELLKSIARVLLIARDGTIGKYIAQLPDAPSWRRQIHAAMPQPGKMKDISPELPVKPGLSLLKKNLEFFNGWGGFAKNGSEYTVILNKGQSTPAPWINVIANPDFGFQVSAEGSCSTWAENSHENQLSPWCNDPVSNPSGEAIYIRDEDTLQLFAATAQPILDNLGGNIEDNIQEKAAFIAHHGRGYSRFEHEVSGLALTLLQYVALNDPIKISRLTLHNQSGRRRRLSVTAYTEWVLGTSRAKSGPFITTELDAESNAILIRNRWSITFASRVAFVDMWGLQTEWTTDRTEFLGRNGAMNAPASLMNKSPLSGTVGAGHDPCTAQQSSVELEPNESIEVVMLMGQCASLEKARCLIKHYRHVDLNSVFDDVKQHWDKLLGAVQVKTPDRAMDIMLNGWLLYQTLACRMWARSAFYQSSGAYGFRDQLQDAMSLTFRRPDLTREHILRAAGRQFVEGDVQHWWLPHTGQGVRTRISDDRVWLVYATASYIQTSGDISILDEQIPFIDGPLLEVDQHDAYFQAMQAEESATLFEHCARALDQCIKLTGERGLPLMGTGDWNDGMNRVGEAGQGESVWLGWFIIGSIEMFAPQVIKRDSSAQEYSPNQSQEQSQNKQRAQNWLNHSKTVKQAIEDKAWDGEWYRRATFDDGSWLGTSNNDECQIDSIAQSWAVLSGAANPERAMTAMKSVEHWLIKPEEKLALLFTPPFDKTSKNPGYIKGYPPGVRENGGQYSHASMWTLLAYTQLGEAKKAYDLFALLNPINHTDTAKAALRYKVEPYVVAADIYSVAPHIGRGGWTWYTGAAGWMYRAGMEGILGIHREGKELTIAPCIPPNWPGFEATIEVENTHYKIDIKQSNGHKKNTQRALLDGAGITPSDKMFRVPLDGAEHQLTIIIECIDDLVKRESIASETL